MSVKFIPIKYHKLEYKDVKPQIIEVASHFGIHKNKLKNNLDGFKKYSLHTDYSGPINDTVKIENNELLNNLNKIKNSYKSVKNLRNKKVSELWKDNEWAIEFAEYIFKVIKEIGILPKIIEIHPPYKEYCNNFKNFFNIYNKFLDELYKKLNTANVSAQDIKKIDFVIENRNHDDFLLYKVDDIINFCKAKNNKKLKHDLKLVVDFPQLLMAHFWKQNEVSDEELENILLPLKEINEEIIGMHIWGYKQYEENKKPEKHEGNLDGLFKNITTNNAIELKKYFLYILKDIFENKELYFIPEVNDSNDNNDNLHDIVNDFKRAGYKFK